MADWTRREVLKSGLAASVGAWVVNPEGLALPPPAPDSSPPDTTAAANAVTGRERLLLDFDWRFHLGHANDPALDFGFGRDRQFAKVGEFFEPCRQDFDVRDWRSIDLPHDWAVELPFENAPTLTAHGSKPLGRAYPATSIGWYRRTFEIPERDRGRRLTLEFDGVFRDALVALNGHFLGRNLSGYAPFRFDISDVTNYGKRNVLVVRADATESEGWFYEGAGIYRHVWLLKTHPVYVGAWGTFVTSALHRDTAALTIETELENQGGAARPVQLVSTVVDPTGHPVATSRSIPTMLQPRKTTEIRQHLTLADPRLWSIATPQLYRLRTTVVDGGVELDRYDTPFGIRTIRFDADQGFFLNGQSVELKGTCNHQDHAGVGTALPDRLQEYRVGKLKAMGSNAYRTSHNPPTPELLDACDRLGMLVLDETRAFSSTDEGLSQLERMIRRDRNHPSIFAWSIANEEWAVQGEETGARIGETMRRLAHRLDPTRPVTAGMDSSYSAGKGISLAVDVQGFNYQREDLDAFHRNFPKRPCMGTEVASTFSTRGVYITDKEHGYISAYDVNPPSYGATAEQWWSFFASRAFLAGGFVWTGFDYRGEPSPYEWPCISSHFGILDTCGFPKDNFYYYQAWWGDAPVLHLFPHWNWPGREGQEIEVWCHSNLERVELFLNSESVGPRDVPRNSHVKWDVRYAPGTLEARGYRGGSLVLNVKRETTGDPAGIVLRPDRARIAGDGEDVAVIEAMVVDSAGRLVPTASNLLTFTIIGSGRLIGLGNGDPSSHESDKGDSRRVFNGLAVAIVQASKEGGDIRVEVTSPALEAGAVVIAGEPVTSRPSAR